MEEIIPDLPEQPEQPIISSETLAEAPNQLNLDIIDTKDITSVYTSTAKPVLNINWDLENPIASEAGLASSGPSGPSGLGNISNTLVAGSFRRSEIDNLLGRNTSVFVSNVTNELFGNGYNAANQISTQQSRPLLARKRIIKIIDTWNRIIFGMNINARDNASLNRFFGANIQTNADVLFRNQITVTTPAPNSVTYNEFNSWTHLVGPDQAFIFSQISRFIVACIYELKEKIKLLNSIVQGIESLANQNIENIINDTDTFNIPDNYLVDYTSLTEPVHIIPDATHKIWNWSVAPTNAASKFPTLGAFAKHIPQKYSIMLFEPSFLLLLQELIDTIMELPEESHFREIFQNTVASGLNPKDLKLVELAVDSQLTSENQKITFDSVKLNGIESENHLETSHLNFNYIYYFYLKHKNNFDFLNETNTYNTKKRKYRFLEDLNTWEEQNLQLPEEEREPRPIPDDTSWNNIPKEQRLGQLNELRKYDFVDDKTYHQPYTENDLYKFPVNKNTQNPNNIINKADIFKDWVLLQKEAYSNLDKLIEVFNYCSDLTSPVAKRAQWSYDSKTVVNGATRYDVGNRIDRILQLNTSKLSNRLGIEYFKSLDNYKTKIDNGELPIDAPVPVPFFKNKIFATELYTGLSGSGQTSQTQRNWRFGWTTVKFPKKFELSPGNFIEATKYLPCSWFNSASNEILFARQFIDITDPDDEMYIGFYNASTSFGVTVQMEEAFRQRHPLLTGTEHMHGTSLVQANTLKAQIHSNFFKLEFIGDSTGKYFPVTIDEINNMELSPNSLTRESIAKADIFVNVKPDNDYDGSIGEEENNENYENDEKFFIENPANPKDIPFIDSFKNLKIFYRLN